jgi:hypothetical protein
MRLVFKGCIILIYFAAALVAEAGWKHQEARITGKTPFISRDMWQYYVLDGFSPVNFLFLTSIGIKRYD